jgi:hypothetical protein
MLYSPKESMAVPTISSNQCFGEYLVLSIPYLLVNSGKKTADLLEVSDVFSS